MNERNELRELDAQIAEKLFGWRWTTRVYVGRTAPQQVHQPSNQFMPPESQVSHGDWKILPYDPSLPRGIQWQPSYSTDGNAMLVVLEKMLELGWWYLLENETQPGNTGHTICFFRHEDAGNTGATSGAPSVPETVCRAALKVLTPETPASHPSEAPRPV